MKKKYSVTFQSSSSPITEYVTKFGGQPVWLTEPQWPISRAANVPMMFICQIALAHELFGDIPGKMAYVFMKSDEEENSGETWNPDAGENAVIIQPDGICEVETQPLSEGPTLQNSTNSEGWKPVEYLASLEIGEDPDFIAASELWELPEDERETYQHALEGTKIGGTPGFIQSDEFPEGGNWNLLLQLDPDDKFFYINFGDAGIGYAFISEDGTRGKLLWQCA
ncbi:MAG: DUF1963 domain-containing protein [Acidobacteriota bacterium]